MIEVSRLDAVSVNSRMDAMEIMDQLFMLWLKLWFAVTVVLPVVMDAAFGIEKAIRSIRIPRFHRRRKSVKSEPQQEGFHKVYVWK